MLNAVAAGVGAQQGLALDGLGVEFAEGRMRLTADRLSYGPADVLDLALVGTLVAQDGRLQLETESISPGGLVTPDPLVCQPGAGAIRGPMVRRRGAHAGGAVGIEDSVMRDA